MKLMWREMMALKMKSGWIASDGIQIAYQRKQRIA
jgi:hypothetical protein